RPVYSPSTAMLRSVLPGFGQFYTARPVRGVVVLALVAGAVGTALTAQTTERTIQYVDPNGVAAPYTETLTERKYFTTGLAAAAGITLGAMIEAIWFANRSQRGASILDPAGRPTAVEGTFTVRPEVARDGSPRIVLRAAF